MPPTGVVQVLSVEQARTLRRELIDKLSFDEVELQRRAERYALTAQELAIYDELRDFDYLLSEV
jgi:hypothetical protein